MTDQTAHDVTDDDRRLAREWANFAESPTGPRSDRALAAARVILAVLPTPPTLADMTDEERAQHVTGQVDVNTPTFAGRGILVGFDALSRITLKNAHAMILTRDWKSIVVDPKDVTPRPDLPPLEWPGTEKPAPALPGGWKLADHEKRGRVIVTNSTPNNAGHVCYVLPAADPLGYDWLFCGPDELTFIDTGQEADQ